MTRKLGISLIFGSLIANPAFAAGTKVEEPADYKNFIFGGRLADERSKEQEYTQQAKVNEPEALISASAPDPAGAGRAK